MRRTAGHGDIAPHWGTYEPIAQRAEATLLLLRMERGFLGLDLLYQFVDAINRKLVGNRFA